jgi:hypothetical protein
MITEKQYFEAVGLCEDAERRLFKALRILNRIEPGGDGAHKVKRILEAVEDAVEYMEDQFRMTEGEGR